MKVDVVYQFVTFIDPTAAYTFYQVASYQGLNLNNRRLKIGWGKNAGPLPASLGLAVQSGATRNVYVGNIEDFETFTEDRLKRDFGEFGEIELVNFLREKYFSISFFVFFHGLIVVRNCAFVNFTNISNAIKAIDGIKIKPEYASLRIAHGKDRCANPPRSGPQGMSSSSTLVGGARRSATGTVTGIPGVVVSGGEVHEGDDGGGGVGDVAFLVDAGVVENAKVEAQEVEVPPVVV